MSDEYFDEFLKVTAYQVVRQPWTIFDGLVSELDLSDEDIPNEPFRLAFTISATEDHTVLEGIITVDGEPLEFVNALRLTSTFELTSIPTITIEGLDCNVLVEYISSSGMSLYHEVLTPIEIVVFPKTRVLRDPTPNSSGYLETNYDVYTEAPLKIGDRIRYTDPHQGVTIDMYVKSTTGAVDLEDNSQPFRVLYCA